MLAWPVRANPVGEQVVAGSAGFNRDGSTLTVSQSSDRAIINWQDFSIGSSELTRFLQPGSTSAALNRVITGNPSSLLGTLQANGQIYLINPNGIMVGNGATINCASFIASTLDVANDAFMSGANLNFAGNSTAAIQNLGNIHALGGDVFLIARTVENRGTISAPDGVVGLAAGDEIFLTHGGDQRLAVQLDTRHSTLGTQTGIQNDGLIEAAQAELKAAGGNIYAMAIYNDGIVRATGIAEKDGRVILTAEGGAVVSSGTLAAQSTVDGPQSTVVNGGTVRVEGGFVGLGGKVDTSGVQGGSVDIHAGGLSMAGEILARGSAPVTSDQPTVDHGLSTIDGVSGSGGNGGSVTIHVDRKTVETSSSVIDVSGANGGTISHVAGRQITSSGSYRALGTQLSVNSDQLSVVGQAAPLAEGGSSSIIHQPSSGHGGRIDITAPAVKLLSAQIDASGTGDGGQIRVGGEYQGGKNLATDEIPNAQILAVSSGTRITADGGVGAAASGDGGTVILWADERAAVYGDISAKGGAVNRLPPTGGGEPLNREPPASGGLGGFVEVSSGDTLTFGGTVETGGGTVLFDPKNITIAESGASTSQYSLVLGHGYQSVSGFDSALDAQEFFGVAVSLKGTRLAVGAIGNITIMAGAVYLFTFADSTFSNPKLESIIGKGYAGGKNYNLSALEDGDRFGISVSLDGNRLAVGATGDDGAGNLVVFNFDAGAVHLFSFADTAFNSPALEAILGEGYTGGKNLDLAALENWDQFGHSVSLDGTRLAVGAYGDAGARNSTPGAGAVYLFNFADTAFTSPTLQATIGKGYTGSKNFDVAALEWNGWGDTFGSGVSLDGTRLAVGAEGDDGSGNLAYDAGAVYFFNVGGGDSISGATFANDASANYTISPSTLAGTIATPQNVVLQANNDITISEAVTVNNPSGNGGNLTLQAGRSVAIHANIVTDNGNLTVVANETAANGVVAAQRESGTATITMDDGLLLDAGSGTIVLAGEKVYVAPNQISLSGGGRYLIYAPDPDSVVQTGGKFFEQYGVAYLNSPNPILAGLPNVNGGFLYASDPGKYDPATAKVSSDLVADAAVAATLNLLGATYSPNPTDAVSEPQKGDLRPYAHLSDAIYDDQAVDGWTLVAAVGDAVSGFHAGIYENPTDKTMALAFRGSEALNDWVANIANGVGLVPPQYQEAKALANWAIDPAISSGKSVVMAGHSLGGGLAELAGLSVGKQTYAFNPAPMGSGIQGLLSQSQLNKATDLIDSITVWGDPVSTLSTVFGINVGIQPGSRFLLDGGFLLSLRPADAHYIDTVVALLRPAPPPSTQSSFLSSSVFSTPAFASLSEGEAAQAIAANLTTSATAVQEQAAETANNRSSRFTSTATAFGPPPPLITFQSGDNSGLTLGGGSTEGILGGASSYNTPPAGGKRR